MNFTDGKRKRVAIAVSMGKAALTRKEAAYLNTKIDQFDNISVREKTLGQYLHKKLNIANKIILDPTLLIEQNEWKKIADYSVVPNQKYVLCYFLGNSKRQRRMATRYAKDNQLLLIHLPYVMGRVRNCDKEFDNYSAIPAGPAQFIALIENASCIFTDSYHAVLFSILFKKEFFVFNRNGEKGKNTGNSRISDILNLVHLENRFIVNNLSLTNIKSIDYQQVNLILQRVKIDSIKWIYDSCNF